MGKRKNEQITIKQPNGGFKPKEINIFNKYKLLKHPYEVAKTVRWELK